jgi:8-oxo-dGTP diphosphatase
METITNSRRFANVLPLHERIVRVGVGLLVTKANGRYILLHRRKGSHGAGSYSTIGGHLEYGESFKQCAIREKNEEAGRKFRIKKLRFLHICNTLHYMPKHYVHVGFHAEWLSGEPELLEPDKGGPWKWHDAYNLPTPLFRMAAMSIDAFWGNQIYRDVR